MNYERHFVPFIIFCSINSILMILILTFHLLYVSPYSSHLFCVQAKFLSNCYKKWRNFNLCRPLISSESSLIFTNSKESKTFPIYVFAMAGHWGHPPPLEDDDTAFSVVGSEDEGTADVQFVEEIRMEWPMPANVTSFRMPAPPSSSRISKPAVCALLHRMDFAKTLLFPKKPGPAGGAIRFRLGAV